ncbi:MAG TPA: aminodeoxychorismate/anthranilate synthase component II [Bacteroidales bacterium]
MAKILVFDNYDSFTYNLVQYVQRTGNHEIDVFLNDEIPLDEMEKYDGIIISPGPGLPSEVKLLEPMITRFKSTKRIFGVCLGQQAIAEAFGAKLQNLNSVFHGVASEIIINKPKHYIFEGLPDTIAGGRYHSWIVENRSLPACLKVEAVDNDGQIMALSHTGFDICSVQFHPESVLTPLGINIIENWLKRF